MLLFDAIDIKLKPVVAYLQQASRKERSPALYDQCTAAMEQANAQGDDGAFILIAQAFGLVIDQHGYSDDSIAWLLQAVDRAKRMGELGEQAQLLHLVGRAYYSRAEYRIALDYWTEGMEVAQRGGDPISGSWCKLGVGQVCDALDAPVLAVKIFTELGLAFARLDGFARTLPLAQRPRFAMRMRELRVVNTVNLGVNQLRLGLHADALTHFQQAQTMAHAEGMVDIAWECPVRMAEVDFLQGDATRALALLEPTQRPLEECSHHWGLASLHLLRAQCQASVGQLQAAQVSLTHAQAAATLANARHIALRIALQAADIAEQGSDLPLALDALKRAVALQTQLDRSAKTHMLRTLETLSNAASGVRA